MISFPTRPSHLQGLPQRGGAGDVAMLPGVAELPPETRGARLHRTHQRGEVSVKFFIELINVGR